MKKLSSQAVFLCSLLFMQACSVAQPVRKLQQPKLLSYDALPSEYRSKVIRDIDIPPAAPRAPSTDGQLHIESDKDVPVTSNTTVNVLAYARGDTSAGAPKEAKDSCVAVVEARRILIPKNAVGNVITWTVKNGNPSSSAKFQFASPPNVDAVDMKSWQKPRYRNHPTDLKSPTLSPDKQSFAWTVKGDRKRGATDNCHLLNGDDSPLTSGDKCEIAYLVWVVDVSSPNQVCTSLDPVVINTGE